MNLLSLPPGHLNTCFSFSWGRNTWGKRHSINIRLYTGTHNSVSCQRVLQSERSVTGEVYSQTICFRCISLSVTNTFNVWVLVSSVLVWFLSNWVTRKTRTSHREAGETGLKSQLYCCDHWKLSKNLSSWHKLLKVKIHVLRCASVNSKTKWLYRLTLKIMKITASPYSIISFTSLLGSCFHSCYYSGWVVAELRGAAALV